MDRFTPINMNGAYILFDTLRCILGFEFVRIPIGKTPYSEKRL